MHKKDFSRFCYTPVFLAMILCGTCHAAPAGFWKNYQAPNDAALTTTAETYDVGRNSKTGAVSLTINQANAAGVKTVIAHPNGSSAYLPGTSNSNVVLYEAEQGSNVFVGKMETASHTYTITSTYDTGTGKFNTVAVDEDGNAARGIASTISITELSDVTYKSGEITKVTTGSVDEQGYFQTNTVTKTGQVTGKKMESTATVRVGDIVTAKNGTNNGQNTMAVYVNGEKQAELTDTNTITEVKAGSSGNITAVLDGKDSTDTRKIYSVDLNKDVDLGADGSLTVAGVAISNGQVVGEKFAITNDGGAVLANGDVRVDGDGTVRVGGEGNGANTTFYKDGTISNKVGGTTFQTNEGGVSMQNSGNQIVVSKDGTSMTSSNGNSVVVSDNGVGISGSTSVDGNVGVTGNISAKNVTAIDSVKVGDNTTINKDGVKTNRVQVGSVVFTPNSVSMGGQQVHGVAAGTADTDAVNFAQLKATEAQFNQRLGDMDNHINRVEDNAYAGVAMALATAGLPQAWQPGKSMIAAAAGTYMGEQGYAIGFSHNTENGKWTLKGTASGNSQGHFGGSVGAGYMW